MAKINFLISQFGKDKDKLCFLVRHFCFYSAAEKGHKIGTAFPWRPADMHPKGAIGSFPQAGLLLGTKSSGFILRKWIKDLYKEVYTKTASNVWMLMLGYHLQILIRNLNKLLYGWKRDFYGVVKSDIKYRIKKKKNHMMAPWRCLWSTDEWGEKAVYRTLWGLIHFLKIQIHLKCMLNETPHHGVTDDLFSSFCSLAYSSVSTMNICFF